MLRRNIRSDFMGGAYVFPGGSVDDSDHGFDSVVGLSDAAASRRLGLRAGALGYFVAGLRELFEEAGLLLAVFADGESLRLEDEAQHRRFAAYRRRINAGELSFASMLRDEGLYLDLAGLEYVAHWITPVGPSRRFDTRFFVARAPAGQVATHDDAETVADTWLRPAAALEAHAKGAFEMVFPTVRSLEAIADFHSADDVLAYAHGLESIPCVEPQIIERDGQLVMLTPGDAGYQG